MSIIDANEECINKINDLRIKLEEVLMNFENIFIIDSMPVEVLNFPDVTLRKSVKML